MTSRPKYNLISVFSYFFSFEEFLDIGVLIYKSRRTKDLHAKYTDSTLVLYFPVDTSKFGSLYIHMKTEM